eukprot:1180630-Prorocentrum_minimum.AAC.2
MRPLNSGRHRSAQSAGGRILRCCSLSTRYAKRVLPQRYGMPHTLPLGLICPLSSRLTSCCICTGSVRNNSKYCGESRGESSPLEIAGVSQESPKMSTNSGFCVMCTLLLLYCVFRNSGNQVEGTDPCSASILTSTGSSYATASPSPSGFLTLRRACAGEKGDANRLAPTEVVSTSRRATCGCLARMSAADEGVCSQVTLRENDAGVLHPSLCISFL